jgi:hypothetical protein
MQHTTRVQVLDTTRQLQEHVHRFLGSPLPNTNTEQPLEHQSKIADGAATKWQHSITCEGGRALTKSRRVPCVHSSITMRSLRSRASSQIPNSVTTFCAGRIAMQIFTSFAGSIPTGARCTHRHDLSINGENMNTTNDKQPSHTNAGSVQRASLQLLHRNSRAIQQECVHFPEKSTAKSGVAVHRRPVRQTATTRATE